MGTIWSVLQHSVWVPHPCGYLTLYPNTFKSKLGVYLNNSQNDICICSVLFCMLKQKKLSIRTLGFVCSDKAWPPCAAIHNCRQGAEVYQSRTMWSVLQSLYCQYPWLQPWSSSTSRLIRRSNIKLKSSGECWIQRADFHVRDTCDFHRILNWSGIQIIYIRIKQDPPVSC